MTDFRALCAELTFCWSRTTNPDDFSENAAPIIERMNAALAQPASQEPTQQQIDKLLAAIFAGIRYGYQAGHEATVESCYGDPDEVAEEMAPEILAELSATAISLPQQENTTGEHQ